jgi:hypothetical protein
MKKVMVTFMVALFATVVLGQTRTEVKPADLPKCVPDYIINHLKGYNIDKAFKMDNKGDITYDVTVMKGKERRALIFDKACKVLKNENLSKPVEPKKADGTPPNNKPTEEKKKPLPPVKNDGQAQPADPKK